MIYEFENRVESSLIKGDSPLICILLINQHNEFSKLDLDKTENITNRNYVIMQLGRNPFK